MSKRLQVGLTIALAIMLLFNFYKAYELKILEREHEEAIKQLNFVSKQYEVQTKILEEQWRENLYASN